MTLCTFEFFPANIVSFQINIVLWPYLGVLLEHRLYDTRQPGSSLFPRLLRRAAQHTQDAVASPPPGVAISIRDLTKTYSPPLFRRSRGAVHAVRGLSLDIPTNGIYVLLGANGAGKSTTLSILGGLIGPTSGDVLFAGAARPSGRPTRGKVGVVPQKNVLFAELTCLQNLRVWEAVKGARAWSKKEGSQERERLLVECGLAKKVNRKAGTLSGGQKRKLQLAIGLVGGSDSTCLVLGRRGYLLIENVS